MAKQIPMTCKLQGKVGGLIYAKNGNVRVSNPGANRTPAAFKRLFSLLAQSWPYGSTEFKNLVQNSPGVYNGVSVLTAATAGVYAFLTGTAANLSAAAQVMKGILPDRLENLPGDFGEDIIRPAIGSITVTGQVAGSNFNTRLTVAFNEFIVSDYEDHRAAAFQCLRDNVINETDVPINLVGIRMFTPTLQGQSLVLDLTAVPDDSLPILSLVSIWAQHKSSGVRMPVAHVVSQLASDVIP